MKRTCLALLLLIAGISPRGNAASTPVISGAVQPASISAGWFHSLGIKSNGTIVAWGLNTFGQRTVPPPNTNFIAVAGGGHHSLGIITGGTIVAWGRNTEGQITIPAPNTNFIAIAGGGLHSMGLRTDGSITAWGLNTSGQTNVPAPNTHFTALSAGWTHSLGLKSNSSVVAWGSDTYGQTSIPAPNTNFIALTAGGYHSLAIKAGGWIVAWGRNDDGQLTVPSPNTNFVAIAAGYYHSLGLKADGSIVAWGDNTFGQCNVPGMNENFIAVAANGYHSLGLKTDGSVVAWGRNTDGQTNVPAPNASFGRRASVANPSRGTANGGFTVSISGYFLPGDITNASLAGFDVASVDSQSTSQLVVVAAAAIGPTNGTIRAYSTSAGELIAHHAFSYLGEQTISFLSIPAQWTTNHLRLAATASSGLPVTFNVVSGPATITGGTNVTFSGSGQVRIAALQSGNADWNPAPGITNTFNVNKAPGTITLQNLNQTYDGSPRVVSADTFPTNANYIITYAGLTNAPIHSGTYVVTGILDDVMYQASATGILEVAPITVNILVSDTNQTYDGFEKTVAVVTEPADIDFTIDYGGQTNGPTNAGLYEVVIMVTTPHHQGATTTMLNIAKADQTIAFDEIGNQSATNKIGLAATATSGLPVTFNVVAGPAVITGGTNLSFTGNGVVGISASQSGDANWNPAGGVLAFFEVDGYVQLTTSNGVPISWLESYGITNDFEQAVWIDHDGDGVITGDEYISDTNPTDATSYLKINSLRLTPDAVILTAPVSTSRFYNAEYSLHLTSNDWQKVPGLTNISPVAPTLTITNSFISAPTYRLSVGVSP